MPDVHARLSPSAAIRWINCPGSIRLSDQVPPAGSSEYADEGTAAHALAELKLRAEIHEITEIRCGPQEAADRPVLLRRDGRGYGLLQGCSP